MLDQDTARALLTVADETGRGSRWSGTGTSCPRSAAAASSTSPPARSTPAAHLTLDAVHRFTADADRPHRARRRVRRADPGDAHRRRPRRGVRRPAAAAARSGCTQRRRRAAAGARRRPPPASPPAASGSRWWPTPASRSPSSTPRSATGWSPPATSTTRTRRVTAGGEADRGRGPGRHPPQRPRPRRREPRHLDRHRRRRGRQLLSPRPTSRPSRRVTPARGRGCCPPTTSPRTSSSAYATTVHGAQGDTVTAAHVVLGEHTGAASAYVGMTRGRAGQHRPPRRRRRRGRARAVDRRVRPRPRRPRPRPRRQTRRREAARYALPQVDSRPQLATAYRLRLRRPEALQYLASRRSPAAEPPGNRRRL